MLSDAERVELLGLYDGLRVADVRDGMDWMMYHHIGSMDPQIRPLWPATIVGFANTMRFLPTNIRIPDMEPDQYTRYAYDYWYGEITNDGMHDAVREGDIVVIDASNTNVGIMGSNVVLAYLAGGARGVVTNGGCRDTDETIHEKFPMWSRYRSQAMNQGRVQFDQRNVNIEVGGQLVSPEDIIVADGDGVIVVPQAIAHDVATWARQELENDKQGRRRWYDEFGWEHDHTVI